MKKEITIYLTISLIVLYLLISFITLQMNVAKWHEITRLVFVLIYLATSYFGVKRLLNG